MSEVVPQAQQPQAQVVAHQQQAVAAAGAPEGVAAGTAGAPPPLDMTNAIHGDPHAVDVLSGRGASVNAHPGNKRFRALCFARKAEFDAGNHAAKRRIAIEIVDISIKNTGSRFLKKKIEKGPWFEMTYDQAVSKACQVMRDYKRPDRMGDREASGSAQARKRVRTSESTPMDGMVSSKFNTKYLNNVTNLLTSFPIL